MKKKKGVHGYTLSIYLLHDAYVFQQETSFPASRHLDGLNCGAEVARCPMEGAAADPSCYKAPKDRVT